MGVAHRYRIDSSLMPQSTHAALVAQGGTILGPPKGLTD
jgi:hypothetical protein